MVTIRRAHERGHFDHGWLDTYHTFSFADYHDPQHMGFRSLRVINEDRVDPGQGFGTHGHRDMEIVTYVLAGALEHKDSLGNGSVLRPSEFQRMTAGTGVMHSEFNPSQNEPVHLYQIWIRPEKHGLTPSWEQKAFPAEGMHNRWQVLASRDARDGSLLIHQDAAILRGELDAGRQMNYPLEGRHAWLQVVRGDVTVNGERLKTSDALAVSEEKELNVATDNGAEVLLFDLA
jgi:quercetin 2,3-dioxygenase